MSEDVGQVVSNDELEPVTLQRVKPRIWPVFVAIVLAVAAQMVFSVIVMASSTAR